MTEIKQTVILQQGETIELISQLPDGTAHKIVITNDGGKFGPRSHSSEVLSAGENPFLKREAELAEEEI